MDLMYRIRVVLSIIWIGSFSIIFGQNPFVDSLKSVLDTAQDLRNQVVTLQELGLGLINLDPEQAIQYSRQSLAKAQELGDPKLIGYSYLDMGYGYYVQRKLDSFRLISFEAIDHFDRSNHPEKIAAIYRNLAKIGEALGEPDSSLHYLQLSEAFLLDYPDSTTLGDVHLSKGFAYRTKGFYNLSLEELFTSLKIFQALDNRNKQSYVLQNIGITNAIMDRFEPAARFSLQAIYYFKETDNLRALSQTQNNLGKIFQELGKIDSSRWAHRQSIWNSEQINQQWVLKQNYWNLGRLEIEYGQLDSGKYWLDKCLEIAQNDQDSFLLAGVNRWYAKFWIQKGNTSQANAFVNRALSFVSPTYDPNADLEALNDFAEIYADLNDDSNALSYWKRAKEIQDSIYTLKQDQQIAELNLIYETEKKDAEIELLQQRAAIDQLNKRILWGGLIFALLLGAGIVYHLLERRKKDKHIHAAEKKMEQEKRKRAEIVLEYKEKELTARILQLAKKNEFLLELEQDIAELQHQGLVATGAYPQKLARKIQHDVRDDDDWDQFVASFTSLHQEFIDKLMDRHGPLSKSELRLVSLLKMNLSSKDIANTLRISGEGIKKARYRLRKKLELDSEIDLQDYILSFN